MEIASPFLRQKRLIGSFRNSDLALPCGGEAGGVAGGGGRRLHVAVAGPEAGEAVAEEGHGGGERAGEGLARRSYPVRASLIEDACTSRFVRVVLAQGPC